MQSPHDMKSYLGWKIDFRNPAGAEAYVGPESVSWRVFKNPVALGIGGVTAVLLEFADARIRSGVWDHSTFKTDPIGRSQRTGMAAMVGVYGPKDAARRVIAGVTNMHRKVEGTTPSGEPYKALDPELLDWVSATAGYGFMTAYDRFVARLTEVEKVQFYSEGGPVARLYGVENPVMSPADFDALMMRLAPRFEPHPINTEFLEIVRSSPAVSGVPQFLRGAMINASVAILPPIVREKLGLGREYDLKGWQEAMLKVLGKLADRLPIKDAPPAAACERLGLPANFLYKSRDAQARILREMPPGNPAAATS